MDDFCKLLTKPAAERRKLSPADIEVLKNVDLDKQLWTPSKTANALELMQIALRLETSRKVSTND